MEAQMSRQTEYQAVRCECCNHVLRRIPIRRVPRDEYRAIRRTYNWTQFWFFAGFLAAMGGFLTVLVLMMRQLVDPAAIDPAQLAEFFQFRFWVYAIGLSVATSIVTFAPGFLAQRYYLKQRNAMMERLGLDPKHAYFEDERGWQREGSTIVAPAP